MKPSVFRALPALLLFLAFLPASLAAVSVYDVIRLSQAKYSDEEIIRLIQTTDSRFFLSADDTLALREAGITESVIREMLSRPAPRPGSEAPAPGRVANASRASSVPKGPADDSRHAPRSELFAGAVAPEKSALGQPNASVTLCGIEVLLVRDPGGFPSSLERARSIARKLNALAASASGRFAARPAGADAKVVFEKPGGVVSDVVAVTAADAAAFRGGGRQPVSSAMLASFWSALLNDYWSIGVAGKPPRYLVDSREGQALERLSLAIRPSAGPRDAAAVRAALNSLARTDRELLRKLPAAVPEDLDFPMRRSP